MRGLICIKQVAPAPLEPRVIKALAQIQKEAKGSWPIAFFWNKGFQKPKNNWEKVHFIAENTNRAREVVLKNNFSYLLNVDSDIILPSNALPELLAANCDISVGLYKLKLGGNLSASRRSPDGKRIIQLTEDDLSQRFVRIHQAGLGCTLIHRPVLEKVKFVADPGGEDFRFFRDCREAGFKILACSQVKCIHLLKNGQTLQI